MIDLKARARHYSSTALSGAVIGIGVAWTLFGIATTLRDNLPESPLQALLKAFARWPALSLSWWLVVALAIVLVGALEGSYRAHSKVSEGLRDATRKLDVLQQGLPQAEFLRISAVRDDRRHAYLIEIRNPGGTGSFNAKYSIMGRAQEERWNAEWGAGRDIVWGRRFEKIAKGDTATIALASVKGKGIGGSVVKVHALNDAGQRIDSWHSGDDANHPGECDLELEVFSDPGMERALKLRFHLSRSGLVIVPPENPHSAEPDLRLPS